MNGTSGFQEVRSSTPDHQRIGSCTSNGTSSEKVPATVFMLQNRRILWFGMFPSVP